MRSFKERLFPNCRPPSTAARSRRHFFHWTLSVGSWAPAIGRPRNLSVVEILLSPFFPLPSRYGKKARRMPTHFFAELKRRNVFKVATAYAVIAWLLIQLALIRGLEIPSWAIKTLVVLLVIGFVVIVFISWAFEATPEGMKRTANVSPDEHLPTWSRRKFALFVITTALVATGLLLFDLFWH
jgi:hypothetical protein